jgi:hypothetical protein
MIALLLLIVLSYSIYAEVNIIENYLVNKDAMIKLRETRRVSLEHFGNIDFFFLTDSIKCCPIELDDFEFDTKKLNLTIPRNQLLTLIAESGDNQRVVMLEESSQLAVVDYKELYNKSAYFGFKHISLTSLVELDKDEILLSFFINNPFNFAMMNYREENIHYLADYLNKKVELPKSNKNYKLLTQYPTTDQKTIFKNELIPAKSIKRICIYQYNKLVKNKNFDSLFPLIKEIALDENIPIKCKTFYTNSLIYNYLQEANNNIKKEYLDYILKVVLESKIKIGESSSHSYSDIKAMQSLFLNTKNEKISAEELFEVSKRILEISENPIVILQAYCGIQFYYLENNNLKKAMETAIESINKYDEPILWSYYKAPDFFNAKPALMYLDYLMENENKINIVTDVIDQFINYSVSHPEFQNSLVLRKAILMDLFDAPLEDVIEAYKQVNTKPENDYVFNQPFSKRDYSRVYFWEIEKKILPRLMDFRKYEIETSSSLKVKRNILLEKAETIHLAENTKILIHQMRPFLFTKYASKDYIGWFKGEIEGNIYWIYVE